MRTRLLPLSLAMFAFVACGDSDTPDKPADVLLTAFPTIATQGDKCGETSSYLSAIENGRYGLIIGDVTAISPRLTDLTFDDGERMDRDACSSPIYPAVDVKLSNVETSFALGGSGTASVAFNSEFVNRWSPQPVVFEGTELQWLNRDKSAIHANFDGSIRVALLVSQNDDDQLIAYEGWLGQVAADGSVSLPYVDSCELAGTEDTEQALLDAAAAVAGEKVALDPSGIPASYLWSLCGED